MHALVPAIGFGLITASILAIAAVGFTLDYEVLPAVTSFRAALCESAPRVFSTASSTRSLAIGLNIPFVTAGALKAAMTSAFT